MLLRTAKSCGPDAPTLASSFAEFCRPNRAVTKRYPRDDGGKRARSPGRARHKLLKPLRAGMPGVPVYSLLLVCVLPIQTAHEAAGATGTRHSPRPQGGESFHARPGRIAPRGREGVSGFVVIARSDLSAVAQRAMAEARPEAVATGMRITFAFAAILIVVALATAANNSMAAIHCSVVFNGIGMMRTSNCPIEISAVERKADVHVSLLKSRLGGAKLANIGHRRPVCSRLPERGRAQGG